MRLSFVISGSPGLIHIQEAAMAMELPKLKILDHHWVQAFRRYVWPSIGFYWVVMVALWIAVWVSGGSMGPFNSSSLEILTYGALAVTGLYGAILRMARQARQQQTP